MHISLILILISHMDIHTDCMDNMDQITGNCKPESYIKNDKEHRFQK